MRQRNWVLLMIVLASLLLRLGLMTLIENPGLNDQTHYYNLGQRLLNGEGFTIDYVWHYSALPEDIVHPIDHWMPLSGVAVALGMAVFGEGALPALAVFVLVGALLPVIVFISAKQYGLEDHTALIAAAFAISLPDFVWNSLRSDSTILNMALMSASIVAFVHGVRHADWRAYLLSGVIGGVAYLTRNDSILLLPLVVSSGVVYLVAGKSFARRGQLWQIALVLVGFSVVVAPWIVRNVQVLGMTGSPETSRMFFMVDAKDHYAYNIPLTLETMFERKTSAEHLAKRLFELAAALKQMLVSLDVLLPMFVGAGVLILLFERRREQLLIAVPTGLWVLGILIAYPLLLPYKSQSGSFEKAYLTIIPLLLPVAALAVERIFKADRWRDVIVVLTVIVMAANSYDLIRYETTRANSFYAYIAQAVETAQALPDVSGDGEIRLMTQDPYIMSYYGISSVMIPFTQTREDVLAIAERYGIDYLMMPAARPVLDPIFEQGETDPRFVYSDAVLDGNRTIFAFYGMYPGGVTDDE
ncbi:MAG: ArnT family glycosyltransferase [Anaerolineae bacterium]